MLILWWFSAQNNPMYARLVDNRYLCVRPAHPVKGARSADGHAVAILDHHTAITAVTPAHHVGKSLALLINLGTVCFVHYDTTNIKSTTTSRLLLSIRWVQTSTNAPTSAPMLMPTKPTTRATQLLGMPMLLGISRYLAQIPTQRVWIHQAATSAFATLGTLTDDVYSGSIIHHEII